MLFYSLMLVTQADLPQNEALLLSLEETEA